MVTIFEQRFVPEYSTGVTTCRNIMSRKTDIGPSNGNGSRPNSGKGSERSGCFFSNMKSILPCELSKLIIAEDSGKTDDLVLIDCQSFMEYSSSHITGALHLNCHTGMLKRRLTQGKVKLHDLFSSAQSKERFLKAKTTNMPVIVYDNACDSTEVSSSSKPISLVTRTLLNEGTNTLILQGGLKEFVQKHQNLCEIACCGPQQRPPECETLVKTAGKISAGPSLKSCSTTGIPDGPPVSEIIPRLFIGNKISASDETVIDNLGIKYILNVTKDHPNYFQCRSDLIYKQISVNDSSQEDIGAHFEDALRFIDEGRQNGQAVLVHCQAGISRSATVVIAFLMKHEKMTLNDAYKLVKEKRPVISPNLNFMGSLLKFEKTSFRC